MRNLIQLFQSFECIMLNFLLLEGAQRRVNCAQDQERGQANNIGTAEIYL